TVNSDGSYSYDPPAGLFSGSDSATFSLCDTHALCSAPQTLTFNLSAGIWFVNNDLSACASACDGRPSHPFKTLAAFQAVNDGVGNHPADNQSIFLYEDGPTYAGPVTLRAGQKLFGQDATASLATVTDVTPP